MAASLEFNFKGPKGFTGSKGLAGPTGSKGPTGYTGPAGRTHLRSGAILGMVETGNSAVVSGTSDPGHYHTWSSREIYGSDVVDDFPGDYYSGSFTIATSGLYMISGACRFVSPTVGRMMAAFNGSPQYMLFDESYVYGGPTACRFANTDYVTAGTTIKFHYNIASGSASSALIWQYFSASIIRVL